MTKKISLKYLLSVVLTVIPSILIGTVSSVPDGLLQRVNITLVDLSKLCIWRLDESILVFFFTSLVQRIMFVILMLLFYIGHQ